MRSDAVRRLSFSAVIGAIYALLTIATGFMSYGSIQLRIAEVLCILPFFYPFTVWGLFAGCLLANLLSPIGALDVVFGSAATLGACFCMAALGKSGTRRGWGRSAAACAMPVLWNGVLVGLAMALAAESDARSFFAMLLSFGGMVALGEAAVMLVLGLPLLRRLPDSALGKILAKRLDSGKTNS